MYSETLNQVQNSNNYVKKNIWYWCVFVKLPTYNIISISNRVSKAFYNVIQFIARYSYSFTHWDGLTLNITALKSYVSHTDPAIMVCGKAIHNSETYKLENDDPAIIVSGKIIDEEERFSAVKLPGPSNSPCIK